MVGFPGRVKIALCSFACEHLVESKRARVETVLEGSDEIGRERNGLPGSEDGLS